MNRRPLLWAGLTCLAVMVALTTWAWMALPSDAQIPTHFNASGQADAYGSKAFGLLIVPVIAALVLGLLYVTPVIDPRRANLARSAGAYTAIVIASMVLFTGVQLVIVLAALGRAPDVSLLMSIGIGALFIVIGLALPRLRSSYLVGIRTPWTLTSDLAWRKTHVLGAWLFVIFGLALIGAGVAAPAAALPAVLLGGVVVILVVPTAYSYVVWRSDPDRHAQV